MPEYDLKFSKKLAEVAIHALRSLDNCPETHRASLYIRILPIEISLKAILEKAGMSLRKIRNTSHDISKLMRSLDKCSIENRLPGNSAVRISASLLRAKVIKLNESSITVGQIIDAESSGASAYPINIRYGNLITHFPAEVVAKAAELIIAFADEHWDTIEYEKTRN